MINVTFTDGVNEISATGLIQWDYGQQLQINGLADLPATFQVHFACKTSKEAVVRIGTTADSVGTVSIPDGLLEQQDEIAAYIYLVSSGAGKTTKIIHLPILARNRPQNYTSCATAAEQTEFEELMTEINTAFDAITDAFGNPPVPVSKGGTGATTAAGARTNLEASAGKTITSVDLNTINSTGVYGVVTASANQPNSSTAGMLIVSVGASTVTQTYFDIASGNQYTRTYASGSWGAWANLTVQIIYSETEPTYAAGAIWIEPVSTT